MIGNDEILIPDEIIFNKIYQIRELKVILDMDLADWRRQFGTSNKEKMGLRIPPFAFTEYGVLMLASVLNSEKMGFD